MLYHKLTLREFLDARRNDSVSLEAVYADTLEAIKEKNAELNIYLHVGEQADLIHQAEQAADQTLAGAPISVKDNFCTTGMPTTASSTVLEGFMPPYDATVVAHLKQQGGVSIGKTNLDAWAHGSSTETSQYGRTLNPRNLEHLPGGSSGGAAASVAADMCVAAIGSETAGSIRQPAAWCGVVGLKPTYGRCSRYGVVAMASSTDSPGPLAKTVEDAALVLNAIAGHDPLDGTTTEQTVPDFTEQIGTSIADMKIGYLYHDIEGIDSEVYAQFEQQLEVFEKLGATVEKAEAMDPQHAVEVYTVVQRGEVSSNLARFTGVRYGTNRSQLGDEAKRRIMLGTHTLSKGHGDKYYDTAQKVRTLFMQDFERLFKKYDVLVSLTSPGFAKKIGASEGAAMFGELEDMLLEPSSITGLPGISVPCYQDPDTQLFLGLNIVAPMWQEQTMIQVAAAFEQATTWNTWKK